MKVLTGALILGATLTANAAPRDTALAQEFLRVSGQSVQTLFADGMRAQLDAGLQAETCDAVKPLLRERNRKAVQRLDALATGAKARNLLIGAVQKVYTDAELRQLVAMFKTPEGQLYAGRQAKMGREIGAAADAFGELAMDDAQALFEDYGKRLDTAAEQCPRQPDDDAGEGEPRDDAGDERYRDDERYDDQRYDDGRNDGGDLAQVPGDMRRRPL